MSHKTRASACDRGISRSACVAVASLVVSIVPASATAQSAGAQAAPPADGKKAPSSQPSWMKKGGPLPPPPAPPPPPPPPPPDPAAIAEATAKDEARKHFEQGLALFDAGSVATALPEFLLSRSIYPTRAATKNAALCLRRLGRFDEALEMNEELLAFAGLTPEEKAIADKELSELRPVVGSIEIDGVQPGATISIDNKPRATTPVTKPIRVPVGVRTVRIFKAGFETFEKRVEAIGGKSVSVHAVLAPLELSGWLQVDEASGYSVDVVLDGAVVGKTPWRGLIATGEHLVVLRGDKRLGTQPARVEVRPSEITPMLLIMEELASTLRVESTMKDANLFVDGVLVGRGSWEGAVRQGSHRVQAGADGFLTVEQRIDIKPNGREVISLMPKRAPTMDFWTEHPPFVELRGAFQLFPTFGGTVGTCVNSECSARLPLGGSGGVRAGVMIAKSWSLGLDISGVTASQTITTRETTIFPTEIRQSTGTVNDTLALRGMTFGLSLGRSFGERFPITLQLGAGGFFGGIHDNRSNGSFVVQGPSADSSTTKKAGDSYTIEKVGQAQAARGFYLAPEVRFGIRLASRFDLAASLGALFVILPNQPTWDPEAAYVYADSDGLATFGPETLAGTTLFSFTPGLAATYRFY